MLATDVGSGKSQIVENKIDQEFAWLCFAAIYAPIEISRLAKVGLRYWFRSQGRHRGMALRYDGNCRGNPPWLPFGQAEGTHGASGRLHGSNPPRCRLLQNSPCEHAGHFFAILCASVDVGFSFQLGSCRCCHFTEQF